MNGRNIYLNRSGEQVMDKNFDLYCAASLMVEASKYLKKHDEEFGKLLVVKAKEYADQIQIDEKLINEVKAYGEQLKERVKRPNQPIQGESESE